MPLPPDLPPPARQDIRVTNSVLIRTEAYIANIYASVDPKSLPKLPFQLGSKQNRGISLCLRPATQTCPYFVSAGVYATVGFLTEMRAATETLPSPFASIAFALIVGDLRLSSSPPLRVVTTAKCFGVSSALLPSSSRLNFGGVASASASISVVGASISIATFILAKLAATLPST
ncbi:hypothetical protein LR48_Vigan03g057600 [Vigna angularis]|uniref:Uncharacterized protein n=1 Tax=Phaseolus angularis TaxID=3914 RepID=A0A0L9U330_PHAAN|nr:hypothetical protein LR48_Vigan03g057600 [Vigna angularis]